jgi:hypothetical protein
VANQINFDNIFEMFDSYGNPDYKKMIDEVLSQYNNQLHFEKEGSYKHKSDQELQMMIGLYFTTFSFFKDYLNSYKMLNQSGNKYIDGINCDVTSYIFNSIKHCLVSSATANHPSLLRTIRELYEVIVIGIAVNQINDKGKYVLLSSFKERVDSISYNSFNKKSFLRDIKSNLKNTVEDRTYYNYNVKSFTDDLRWTYPLFKMIDPYQKKVKLEKCDDGDSWNITISNLAHLMDVKGYSIVEFETATYSHLSIFEHFSNSINPTIHRMEFAGEVKELYNANIKRIRESCKSACIFITHIIDSFFYSTAIPQRISLMLSNMVRVINYGVSTSILDEVFDELEGLHEELSGITYNDSKFMELLKNKILITKDKQKERINKYFSLYKDKFLVTNDVFNIDKVIEGDEHSLNNIAIKYLNIFRSLLFGLRYYQDNELPHIVTAKHTYLGYPKSVSNKKTFLSGGFENYKEDSFDVLTISVIQGISNICNSALIGDDIAILEEARILYESVIMKTYINLKLKDDASLKENIVSEYFDECSKVIMPQQKVLIMRDSMINDELNNQSTPISLKKRFVANSERYTSRIDNNLLFGICKDDGLESFDEMLRYLGRRNINLHLTMFDKFYNQKSFETLPYINKSKLSDDEFKLIIMDLSLLVFKSLKYDFLADRCCDDKVNELIELGIYMVDYDLSFMSD